MGDLNFRLDDVSRDEVEFRIKNNDLQYLYQFDQVSEVHCPQFEVLCLHSPFLHLQLKKAMDAGVILVDFQEESLTFPPTYKFDQGTDVYDTR